MNLSPCDKGGLTPQRLRTALGATLLAASLTASPAAYAQNESSRYDGRQIYQALQPPCSAPGRPGGAEQVRMLRHVEELLVALAWVVPEPDGIPDRQTTGVINVWKDQNGWGDRSISCHELITQLRAELAAIEASQSREGQSGRRQRTSSTRERLSPGPNDVLRGDPMEEDEEPATPDDEMRPASTNPRTAVRPDARPIEDDGAVSRLSVPPPRFAAIYRTGAHALRHGEAVDLDGGELAMGADPSSDLQVERQSNVNYLLPLNAARIAPSTERPLGYDGCSGASHFPVARIPETSISPGYFACVRTSDGRVGEVQRSSGAHAGNGPPPFRFSFTIWATDEDN